MTPKQAIFYGEYIKDLNGARAARACGASESNAAVYASRMLKNPKVSAAIDAWKERQQTKYEITAERVLLELTKLATFDPGNLYDAQGNRIPVHLMDDFTRAAVAAVEDETTESVTGEGEKATRKITRNQKIKMAEKGANLERLGRYFGIFKDNLNVNGKLTLEQLVVAAAERGRTQNAGS